MFTSFKELEAYVLGCGMKKRIALANAHDEPALSAVVNARRKGVVEGTLVGKKNEIIAMLHEMGESEKDYEIVDFDGEELETLEHTQRLFFIEIGVEISHVFYRVDGAHPIGEIGLLGQISYLGLGDLAGLVAVYEHLARVIVDKAGKYFDKRSFARAVGAEQADDLAALKAERHIGQHLMAAV